MANLVFKFNWDHRPFQLNSAQGKRHFMLPFASGIPNLNPNFSQVQGTAAISQGGTGAMTAADARSNLGAAKVGVNDDITEIKGLATALSIAQGGTGATTAMAARVALGLGTAANKDVGNKSGQIVLAESVNVIAKSSVVEKYIASSEVAAAPYDNANTLPLGERVLSIGGKISGLPFELASIYSHIQTTCTYSPTIGGRMQEAFAYNTNPNVYKRFASTDNTYGSWRYDLTSANTTTDGNGFLKSASPIVQLFSDQIKLNDEATQQPIIFEKLDTGDYLVRGSLGFSQDGWYVEQPKDANGNVLVAVVYKQLENNDISVKTYKKKFDLETASIVADLDKPVDIPNGRWIDLRLQELPQPEVEEPISNAPPDFQPTGIAKAVQEMMYGAEPSENLGVDKTL